MTKWINRMKGERSVPAGAEWQKVGGVPLPKTHGINQIRVDCDRSYRKIKLRSLGADIDVYRCILEFHDGTIIDLSVNCLVDGSESRPMAIAGKRLKEVVVKFCAIRVSWRGRLEIWAKP